MYICIDVNMYICIYVSMYLCKYAYMHICIYVYMYICIYVYLYLSIYLSIYIYELPSQSFASHYLLLFAINGCLFFGDIELSSVLCHYRFWKGPYRCTVFRAHL